MHSVRMSGLVLELDKALISMPADGSAWDWLCEEWAEFEQKIEIRQYKNFAVVEGLNRSLPSCSKNEFRLVEPSIETVAEAINCFINKYDRQKHSLLNPHEAVSVSAYAWGKLLVLIGVKWVKRLVEWNILF